jgi:hypothetical protein
MKLLPMDRVRIWTASLVLWSLVSVAAGATVGIQGRRFTLDGRPFDMWGIRVAGASQNQAVTDQLLAQLDTYRAHGVNTVSVYYMGCASGYSDPFTPDGRGIAADHRRRMQAIIRAADERGMVVIVGIFYQRSDTPQLRDWEAARTAVETVAVDLRPHRNVILNLANEQNSTRYRGLPWERVNNPDDLLALARLAKAAAPGLLVGAGGYLHEKNEVIGRAPEIDTLLFDTNGPEDSGKLYQRFRAAGVDKPMVNVETFGGWTLSYLPQGVFPDEVKREYLREVAAAAAEEGLSLHFHNSPWCQAVPEVGPIRYDLGGRGTQEDPGIRWYFEAVREVTAGRNTGSPRAAPPATRKGA